MENKSLILKFRRKESYKEIVLLLSSMGIPFKTYYEQGRRIIEISPEDRKNALYQILLYRQENKKTPELKKTSFNYFSYYSIVVVFFFLYLFQIIGTNFFPEIDFNTIGGLIPERVRGGEFYRVITSLTLHKDFVHLLSNAFFGGIITYFLLNEIGCGSGWFVILITGCAGNFLNSLLFDVFFLSIGSSTAFFGALGVLSMLKIFSNNRNPKSFMLPLTSSLALLGMFGSSPGTDIGGHLMGYISGLIIGYPIARFKNSKSGNILKKFYVTIPSGIISLLFVVLSWYVAFKKAFP